MARDELTAERRTLMRSLAEKARRLAVDAALTERTRQSLLESATYYETEASKATMQVVEATLVNRALD